MQVQKTIEATGANISSSVLYEMLQRNSYYLPAKKSGFCTLNYLVNVRKQTFKVPMYHEVSLRPCPVPPKKEVLIEGIRQIEHHQNVNFGISVRGPWPDTQWLVTVLGTYMPGHYIFSKDFRPQKEKAPRLLDNTDDFFDDLPQRMFSKRVKRHTVIKKLALPQQPQQKEDKSYAKSTTLTPQMNKLKVILGGAGAKRIHSEIDPELSEDEEVKMEVQTPESNSNSQLGQRLII